MSVGSGPSSGFRERQRSRILDAAARLLTEHHLEEVTLRAVADEAGLTRPTVYRYFPDLHHIIADVAARWLAEFEAELATNLERLDDPRRELAEVIASSLTAAGRNEMREAARANLEPEAAAIVVQQIERLRAHVVRILDDGRRQGVFRSDLDPTTDSHIVMAALNGLRQLADRGELTDPVINRAVELVLDGVAD